MIVLNVSFAWSANFRICEHLSTMTMFHKQSSSWVFCVFSPFLSLVTWLPCRCYCPFIHSLIEIILLLLQLPISKKRKKKNSWNKESNSRHFMFFLLIYAICVCVNNTFVFANLSPLNYEQGQWYFYSWLLRKPTY